MPIPPPAAIVIVDDEPAITTILTSILRRFFPLHPVYACQTPAQALAYVTQTPVACVLTDYALGRENGDTLAQTIHTQWPELPIVLMTGFEPEAHKLAADTYVAVLIKPMSIHTLRDTLQPYLCADPQPLERVVGA